MDGYLDFGSDSDGDGDSNDEGGLNQIMEVDSDEEERRQNDAILQLLMKSGDKLSSKSRKEQVIDDFEAEMEAELDRRAIAVEAEGGVEHQRSLSRSSSTSSLNQLALPAPAPENKTAAGPSSSKRSRGIIKGTSQKPAGSSTSKSVRFSSNHEEKKIETFEATEPTTNIETKQAEKKSYESIYFDSDESEGEDEETKGVRREKREFVSNDDLFYDPKSDANDQAWVDKRRRRYCFENKLIGEDGNPNTSASPASSNSQEQQPSTSSSDKLKPLPNSEAVLNCPACFSLLTLDCQRHDIYNNQYRAMFVTNCIVNNSEVVIAPLRETRKGRGGKNKQCSENPSSINSEDDKFNPVKCKICHSQLGFYDHDEVYHFINVLASYA